MLTAIKRPPCSLPEMLTSHWACPRGRRGTGLHWWSPQSCPGNWGAWRLKRRDRYRGKTHGTIRDFSPAASPDCHPSTLGAPRYTSDIHTYKYERCSIMLFMRNIPILYGSVYGYCTWMVPPVRDSFKEVASSAAIPSEEGSRKTIILAAAFNKKVDAKWTATGI